MDLNSLKDQVSNLTLYDLKAGVRKVQNGMNCALSDVDSPPVIRYEADRALLAVMNYTEMESKVRQV